MIGLSAKWSSRGLSTARRKKVSFNTPASPSELPVPVAYAACTAIGFAIGMSVTLALQNDQPRPISAKRADGRSIPSSIPANGSVGEKNTPTARTPADLTAGSDGAGQLLLPGSIGPISDFLQRQAYTTAYDRRNRIPAWTAEFLTAEGLKGVGNRQDSQFSEDEEIPERFRAKMLDYFKSGYDRGHMVPAADAKGSQEAMSQTFLLSNIAPQVGEGFNRHYWAYLEQFCRDLTKQFEYVYVFTVPLFLPRQSPDGKWRVMYEMIAPPNSPPSIAVPTHFAKVIMASRSRQTTTALSLLSGRQKVEKDWSVGAFVLPNQPIPDEASLESFAVPVEAVERSAGLTLLPPEIQSVANPLCQTIQCQVVVRRFDDSQKRLTSGENGGGGSKGGRRRERSATL